MGHVNVGHYVLGTVGLALLRSWVTGERAAAERHAEALERFLAAPDQPPLALELDAPEESVRSGYARWASSYDGAPNALIDLEQPVVRRMLEQVPAGDALDAACGTGRHTRFLHAAGHRCVGVDASPDMLAVARAAVPEAAFREGDVTALPFAADAFDLVVCALALTHCPDPTPAVAELARVLRPGGRLIVSDLHPAMVLIGGTALFFAGDGTAGFVPTFHHTHAAYLAAFRAAGLRVRDCVEPAIADEQLPALSGGLVDLAAEGFRDALVGLPMALVWELAREPG